MIYDAKLIHIFKYYNSLSTVYPVWTGIGAVGTVIVGIIFFNEPANFWRLFFISTLIISIIGLKLIH